MTLADFRLPRPLHRVLVATARATCPDEIETLGIAEQVANEVEDFMRALPTYIRAGLIAGLSAFEASPAVWPGTVGKTFSMLDRDRARAHFDLWWSSRFLPLHEFARSVKALLAGAYYEHPLVKQRLGFTPEKWIDEVKRMREQRWADEIRAHEELLRAPDPLVPAASLTRRGADA